LLGDLIEQYHNGRSAAWYKRQVLTAILTGAGADIRDHKLLAVRALAVCWTALFLVGSFTGALHRLLFRWAMTTWKSEILRQAWVYYGMPYVIIMCLAYAVTGWLIARLHRDHRATMVILCALSQLPGAIRWGWETGRLLRAGLWPFWDFRLALLFHAATLFIGYPSASCSAACGLRGLTPRRPVDFGFTEEFKGLAQCVAFVLIEAVASAQTTTVKMTAPADVAAPPADAVRTPSGLASKACS
jgi:hypothetical protein